MLQKYTPLASESYAHPEAYAWGLVTGAAFGIVRARTGSAIGLIIPHAVGNWLFSALASILWHWRSHVMWGMIPSGGIDLKTDANLKRGCKRLDA